MTEPALSHLGLSHLGLCVADLDRSLRFWCDGLGFELAEGFDLDDTMLPGLDLALEVPGPVALRSQMITLDAPGGPALKIELLAYRSPTATGAPSSSRHQLGFTHLSFLVDDIDATITRLVEAGGTLLEPTRQTLGIDLVFIADPDGTRVELMSR
jgi:catechol 2,3-dioxygenase-like lactoylglutathione lyase family enzyme